MDATDASGVSMYLSFDAESTMSSVAYKTLEGMTDVSGLSTMDADAEDSSHMNSTLEAGKLNIETSPATVKKYDGMQLRAFSKNLQTFKDYAAVCSTPTKEQLVRSVEIFRGSDVGHTIDFDMEFSDVTDIEKRAAFFAPVENKENQPESSDGSTVSVSSSVETVTAISVIENDKIAAINELWREIDEIKNVDEIIVSIEDTDLEATSKLNVEEKSIVTKQEPAIETEVIKPKRNILAPKNTRKTICEPDLLANRPSRIQPPVRGRPSIAAPPSNNKAAKSPATEAEEDIPQLLNKMLKLCSAVTEETTIPTFQQNDKRKSVGVKMRTSMLPVSQPEKRTYGFTQRMSTIVKTTLNSPARKIARKTITQTATTHPSRRSYLPTTAGIAGKTSQVRKSGMSCGAQTNAALFKPLPRTAAAVAVTSLSKLKPPSMNMNIPTKTPVDFKRKSIYTTTTATTTTTASSIGQLRKPATTATTAQIKTSAPKTFICSVCSAEFRIKSLLDAHRHCHDDGPMLRKTSTATLSSAAPPAKANVGPKQCKYCDKKFAIERALHIHLLQNCRKIPPADKRKLEFTDMNHVEKAQLPSFFHAQHSNNNSTNKMPQRSDSNMSSSTNNSTGSQDMSVHKIKKPTTVVGDSIKKNGLDEMPAPSTKKVIKKTAHAGVYRTPSKSIKCHKCKVSFKSIMDHIDHNMRVHPSDNLNQAGDTKAGHKEAGN